MKHPKLSSIVLILVVMLSASVNGRPRPTFDKIAEILDVLIDDGSQYGRPRPGPRPYAPSGPLIQEGYHQGYDYSYGSGHGYGSGIGYAQSPPLQGGGGGYDYYPRHPPQEVRPSTAYYGNPHYTHRQQEPGYGYTDSRDYAHGYGRSYSGRETIGGHDGPGSIGGYKTRGY